VGIEPIDGTGSIDIIGFIIQQSQQNNFGTKA
jgi:hypothetical protein